MKRLFFFACVLACSMAGAQSVLDSRPAHSGAVLSNEESNSAKAYPSRLKDIPEEIIQAPEPRLEAYTKGGSLYYKDEAGNEFPVAISENSDISYGCTVSRNEFGISGGIFWSDDQSRLAFYRKDESRVTDFPLLDITSRTGSLKSIKYPMNGMASEHVSLGIFDVASGRTVYAKVTDFSEERYLTNVSWAPDSRYIFIHVIDRSQHHLNLNMYDAETGDFVRTIASEENDAWIEAEEPLHFIKGSYEFLYTSNNRDGYTNLYLCDTLGVKKRFTAVDADVQYIANDGKNVYYTSAEVSPVENHLFRLGLGRKAKPQRLTPDRGWHNIRMSDDCSCFLDCYSSFNVPFVADLRKNDGSLVRNVKTSEDPLADKACGKVEFGTVPDASGKYENYYRLFYPVDFDPSRKYPLIVYVYGGPHSQMVQDRWLGGIRAWEMVMAQKGYVVYVQDNRGTRNRGTEFEKAINRQCGQVEMADQMAGIRKLMENPWIDSERVGVHGWSYGGFMTLSLATNYPETFKVAVAGGPVIDWKWYEVMYGERYMDTAETNPEGFDRTSLMNKVGSLKAKTIIFQGAMDNTVVWEHSLSFIQECINQGVLIDYFPYPCAEHNMSGKDRIDLYRKITDYFLINL